MSLLAHPMPISITFFAGQGANYSNGASGTATLNLRGLGSERTLVLVNGRRVVPGDPNTSAADINIIPGAMVKRIDVLTGGASSVYGADGRARRATVSQSHLAV